MGDSNDVFEVEKILNHKVSKGVTYYRLKWKGFSMSDCTWEKESNLDCKELLDEYWENYNSAKKTPDSPNTKTSSPLNKKQVKQAPEKQTKISFLRNVPLNSSAPKKIDTSSLTLNSQKERSDSEKNKKEFLEKVEGKKKKVIQPQIDKMMKLLRNSSDHQDPEKEKKVEQKEIVSQDSNQDYEILAAAKNPKNGSVLYLVKCLNNGEVKNKIVTSDYARKHLLQPLINFFVSNLKITKPI